MKGADVIAEILRRENTEFLACYPAQDLIDACAKVGIRPILCRQERMGMAIADGFSRTTNGKRLGVFAMQIGPGTENSFPGAAQAYSDNVPLLLLPGGEPTTSAFIEPNFSAIQNYAHVTKWQAQINHVERIPELMRRAFYQLRTGKGGPVLLEIPKEIFTAEMVKDIDYKSVKGNKFVPDPAEVEEVTKVLLNAERLVINAGQGCLYAETWTELQEIAELLRAPVMTTMPGKSAFPENHPLALGASTSASTKQTAHFLNKADVIFCIGTSLTRTPYGRDMPTGKLIVHSTNDSRDVNKNYKADYALIGDAKLVLQAIVKEVKTQADKGCFPHNEDPVREIALVKKEWLAEWMPQLTSDEVPINQYRIIWDLLQTVDRANTIITHDAGSPRDQIIPFWETIEPRTYMGWGKSTQLGYGLGIIMGAKLAEPNKLCINIMGDAAIGMVGMDIETAARNRIGILTIVFNNGIMAIERDLQPFSAKSHDTLRQDGNYKMIGDALGAYGMRVEAPDQFIPALKKAIEVTKSGQPALIECMVKAGFDFSKYP